jgi:hypothetical protein
MAGFDISSTELSGCVTKASLVRMYDAHIFYLYINVCMCNVF